MIDLHSHILPAIDDGAESLRVSTAMLDAATGIGIDILAATPHLTGPLTTDYADLVDAAFRQVEPEARAREIELVRGFEIRLTPDVPARLREGEPSALGDGSWVLVDLPFVDEWPHFVDDTLFNIQTSGFGVILAHPERYPHLQREPKAAVELVGRGIALQVTAGSFSGIFGKAAKRAAETLLRLGVVHLVATDAHSAGHRMAAVPSGLKRLEALTGAGELRRLCVDSPRALLNDEALPPPARTATRTWRDRLPIFR